MVENTRTDSRICFQMRRKPQPALCSHGAQRRILNRKHGAARETPDRQTGASGRTGKCRIPRAATTSEFTLRPPSSGVALTHRTPLGQGCGEGLCRARGPHVTPAVWKEILPGPGRCGSAGRGGARRTPAAQARGKPSPRPAAGVQQSGRRPHKAVQKPWPHTRRRACQSSHKQHIPAWGRNGRRQARRQAGTGGTRGQF